MSTKSTRESVSAVLVTQGNHKFYTLSLDSDILGATCAATSRKEDPIEGFQRTLDVRRAESIRDYIDGGGVIPGSIVLSAQETANINYDSKKKTLQFDIKPGAFLIIDGQHRVFGFRLSTKKLRVPVVIFSGLSKRDEARLFIHINTLQKSVPNELLLDIKKLAESETESETQANTVFDQYFSDTASYLNGLLSSIEKAPGKITRPTFLAAFKPLIKQYSQINIERLANIFDNYLKAFDASIPPGIDFRQCIAKPIMFRAVASVFPTVARLVGFQFNKSYSASNFEQLLKPLRALKKTHFISPGSRYKDVADVFEKAIDQENNDL